jgi:signal peptidase II
VGLDQWTKKIAVLQLSFFESYPVLFNILKFQLVYNPGAAYGIFQNQRWLLVGVGFVMMISAVIFRRTLIQTVWSKIGLTSIIIGTIGNTIDRIRLGYVVDFIDINIIPVFNIADICITLGVVCFVIEMLIDQYQQQ